jgi:hypothetical protein
MTDEFEAIREKRAAFMRAAYKHRKTGGGLGWVEGDDIKRELGMDTDPYHPDDDEYVGMAQVLESQGLIKRFANGYGVIRITPQGIAHVEGDLPERAPAQSVIFNVGNAYNSIFGTQRNAQMNNVSFDFETIEEELNRAEEEVERRGGPDADELKRLLDEVREIRATGDRLEKGRLARYTNVVQRNGWISGPIAGSILGHLTGT